MCVFLCSESNNKYCVDGISTTKFGPDQVQTTLITVLLLGLSIFPV